MIKLILSTLFLFLFSSGFSQEEKIKKILKNIYAEHPSLLAELYQNTNKSYDQSNKVQKSDYLSPSIISNFKIKDGKLFNYNSLITLKKNYQPTKQHKNKIKSHPHMIYRWDFNIKEKGDYLIYQPSFNGATGILGNRKVLNIHHNIISILFSGSEFISFDTGSKTLFILKNAHGSETLKVINKKDLSNFSKTINIRFLSEKEEDIAWIENSFYPALASRSNSNSNDFIKLFQMDFFKSRIKKNKSRSVNFLVDILKRLKDIDRFQLDAFLYEHFKDLYFTITGSGNRKKSLLFNLRRGSGYRYDLVTNYIFTGQPQKAEAFIKDYLEFFTKTTDKSTTDHMHAIFYAQLFSAYFQKGNIRKCNEIRKKYEPTFKKHKTGKRDSISIYYTLKHYVGASPKTARKLIITDSTEKISALKIKEIISSYKGDSNILDRAYELFTGIKYILIDFENNFSSIRDVFVSSAFSNKKFLKDFRIYCQQKLEPIIKKALNKKDIKKIELLIRVYGDFLPLRELHFSLFNEYYNKGDFTKAHYYGKWVYKNVTSQRNHIISKLKLLEEINQTPYKNRINLSKHQQSLQVKFKGKSVKIAELNTTPILRLDIGGMGKLLLRIPLPKDHSQYTNHPIIDFHQGAESMFTSDTLYITMASSIQAIDLKSNKIIWSSISKNEYYNGVEKGPHQKRFISKKAGNSILYFTNRDHSSLKTVKCFNFDGSLRWDLSGQSAENLNPITTPIPAGDALFSLSYNGRGTFKSLNFDVIDPFDGKLIKSIPMGIIDPLLYDTFGGRINYLWNNYRHDNHFIKDENYVYGYTGTGINFKADINSKELVWGKAFNKPNRVKRDHFIESMGFAPSGFIKLFKEILVTFTPENQSFIGINKNSGKLVWRSLLYRPNLIHSRNSKDSIYISDHAANREPTVSKINPQNGKLIWRRSFNGLIPKGEGQVHNGKIYIPCNKSIVIIEEKTGKILEIKKLKLQPLKIRYSEGYWIIFTINDAYLLKADNQFAANQLIQSSFPETGFVAPEKQNIELPYGSIILEKAIHLPEKLYGTGNIYAKTKLYDTALPYHHIMKLGEHVTLFREGFEKQNGTYIPPTIIWYEQIPYHFLMKNKLLISEPGQIRLEDLFTRKLIWQYQFNSTPEIYRNTIFKPAPLIVSTDNYVAFQTSGQSIRILDAKTGKHLFDFNAPKTTQLAICKNYVVTTGRYKMNCFDLNQFGKKIWSVRAPGNFVLMQEKDKIFYIEYNPRDSYKIIDLTNGKIKKAFLRPKGKNYNKSFRESIYKFGENYSFTYHHLYDSKTGKLIKKYDEVHLVRGGGYFCFDKLYGQTGVYIEKGNVYKFKTHQTRNNDNPEIGIMKKDNKIIVQAVTYIQTFEIKEGKLQPIHYIKNNAAKFGNHGNQRQMLLQPLDNSLLELRDSQLFFFRNFDPLHNFQKFESFRVANKNKSVWPYSELYPETEVKKQQWVSSNNSKPARSLKYLAFGDKDYAYLKINISQLKDKSYSNILYISTQSFIGQGAIKWDPDQWKNCTTNYIFKGRVISWKEIDLNGNINLFLKFPYKDTFHRSAKWTLPKFSIELRQYKNGIDDGCYRIGGAFYIAPDFFNWNTKENNESQQISNFQLRSNIYSSKNFYPQGNEFIKWISDRRKFYSTEDNILLLKRLTKKHSKNFCVINILSTLLMEEIQLLREKQPDLLEIDPKFKAQLQIKIKQTESYASSLNIKKEWINFALTIWIAEIYPRKISFSYSRDFYSKSIYNFLAKGIKRNIYENKSKYPLNPISQKINIPYLEFLTPGLFTGYTPENKITKIVLHLGMINTYLGDIQKLSPTKMTSIISKTGKLNPNVKMSHKTKPAIYYFNNKKYEVLEPVRIKRDIESIEWTVPPIIVPKDKSYSGLDYESVLNTLNNLPTDSQLGESLIHGIRNINKKISFEKLKSLYIAWLKRIRYNSKVSLRACDYIFRNLPKDINQWETLKNIFKESKLKNNLQRSIILKRNNQYIITDSRSVLGPIIDELKIFPEDNLSPTMEYEGIKKKYKFKDKPGKVKGKYIYVVMKITVPKRKRCYFISKVREDYNNRANEIISMWINKRKMLDSASYREYDSHVISKKITLRKGENILLIKFENTKDWNALRYRLGDLKGFPIKGIEIQKFH